jgi:choline-glycine betaine transporter
MTSSTLFFLLIIGMWVASFLWENAEYNQIFTSTALLGDYFKDLPQYLLPINLYHEFYLYWWFSWYIMIGQFLARFVGGIRTYQLLLMILIIPSIPLGLWFSVIYIYHQNNIEIYGLYNLMMMFVGTLFVINSLDSLIRLYTDNLNLTPKKLGLKKYISLNIASLSVLTMLYNFEFLQIEWIGAIVIAMFLGCLINILLTKYKVVNNIKSSPLENKLDFSKVDST